ncbi:hypothetical protein BaRGS_00007128 [Batillaria attramentaria]|uniref:Uncharacterized protein n=1 Tax=Batillaria attramentaria TaxID=370345 RepID=A0ABD0LQS8_9CAEN
MRENSPTPSMPHSGPPAREQIRVIQFLPIFSVPTRALRYRGTSSSRSLKPCQGKHFYKQPLHFLGLVSQHTTIDSAQSMRGTSTVTTHTSAPGIKLFITHACECQHGRLEAEARDLWLTNPAIDIWALPRHSASDEHLYL